VNGIREFEDLPVSSRALSLLARGRRLCQPMPADRIREQARLNPEGSPLTASMPEAVGRMIEFEQRFGGLWYSILRERENGMEYGLQGDCTVCQTGFGLAFRGIVDGAWTWPVHVLHDGRTLMRLGDPYPDRVIDSSVIQRIESDALLAIAGRWAHHRYTFTMAYGTEPAVNAEAFPPVVPEATGPAKRWWLDGDRAVFLRLRSWWTRGRGTGSTMAGPDRWTMWCFSRTEAGLAWASGRHTGIPGTPIADGDWCVMCLQPTPESLSCKPTGSQ
jgi:hypothetical protein